MSEPFVVEGKLLLEPQEGGNAADDFRINGGSLVAEHFGVQRVRIKDLPPNWKGLYPGVRPIGLVRITIERLDI